MKLILNLFVIFSLFFGFVAANDELGDVKNLISTLHEFGTPRRDEVWPNFDLKGMPTVAHFKNGHAYAFHFHPLSKEWHQKKIQGYPVSFSKNQSTLVQIPLHPSYNLEGTKAFVYSMDHNGQSDFALMTFVHERFHLHQFSFFEKLNEVTGDYADHHHLENLAMMELELRLLTQFLSHDAQAARESYLKDFAAVSALRRSMIQPVSLNWEDHLQRMEGMADYVSLKTFQVFPHLLVDFKVEEKLLEMRAKKVGSSLYQDTTRGRHYFVGAVMGFALDYCHVNNWKLAVAKGTIPLNQLLINTLPMTRYEQQVRLAHAMEEFDYRSIKETLRAKLIAEQDNLKAMQESFEKEEGMAICVSLPHQRSSAGGRHSKSYHFEKLKVLIEETSTAISQDQRWKLMFQKMPILFEENNGSRTFKINKETMVNIDGKDTALSTINQPLYFSELSLDTPNSQLKTSLPGRIYSHNQVIKIECLP